MKNKEIKNKEIKKEKRNGRKKGRKWIIFVIVIAVIAVVLWLAGRNASSNAVVMVNTTQATRGDLEESLSNSGTVVSEVVKVVFSPVSGNVDQVLVNAGDAVNQGDLLVSYDMIGQEEILKQAELQNKKSGAVYQEVISTNTDNQKKLVEANTNLEVLKQQIADNKTYLKTLQKDYEKKVAKGSEIKSTMLGLNDELALIAKNAPDSAEAQSLRNQINDLNRQLEENAKAQEQAGEKVSDTQELIAEYESYKARMESQKSGSEASVLDGYQKTQYSVDKQLSEMSYQEAQEDYEIAGNGIRAEFNGIVTDCSVLPGAPLAQGAQVLTLQSSEQVKVTFQASKHDLEKLQIGQQADITILGHSYQGEITKIDRMASANTSGTPMVGVEAHILNPDENIILGMDAKLEVAVGSTKDAILLPVEAINADKNGDFVYVCENGVAARRDIKCGISSDLYVEILEGITEEEQVITNAMGDLEEGMNVTVIPEM
ncbi:MAG: efflux RND transporter periplasmic adaptor subunit [Acetatifactor sp.]|nr:efflux RND transporter periplasmic adaptor subunit [Acetatifactor sp.]